MGEVGVIALARQTHGKPRARRADVLRSRFASLRKPHAGGAPALPPPSQERHSHDDVTKSAAAAIQKARLAEDAWNTRDPAKSRVRLHHPHCRGLNQPGPGAYASGPAI